MQPAIALAALLVSAGAGSATEPEPVVPYVLGGHPASRQTDRTVHVHDIASDRWTLGPQLPRLGNGLSPLMMDAHEVFDPRTRSWTTAAPVPGGRSGINGVVGSAFVDDVIWVTGGGTQIGGSSGGLHDQACRPAVSGE